MERTNADVANAALARRATDIFLLESLSRIVLCATCAACGSTTDDSSAHDVVDPSDPTHHINVTPDVARLCDTMCDAMIADYGVPPSERSRCSFQCDDSFESVPDASYALVACLKDGSLCNGGDVSASCQASAGSSLSHWEIANGICRGCYQPSRVVSGTSSTTYTDVTGGHPVVVPDDLTSTKIAAYLPTPSGAYIQFPGTGTKDGHYRIPDVPGCSYFLAIGTNYTWEDGSSTTDVTTTTSSMAVGDPSAPVASAGTTAHFALSNLSPWTDRDDVELYIPTLTNLPATTSAFNGGLVFSQLAPSLPTAGGTTWDVDVDWSGAYRPQNQDAWFVQLRSTTSGEIYQTVTSYANQTLTLNDATTTTIAAAMTTPTAADQKHYDIHWARSQFAAFASDLNPRSTPTDSKKLVGYNGLDIVAHPDANHGQMGPDYFWAGRDANTYDLDFHQTLVDPLPNTWNRYAIALWHMDVSYDTGGATVDFFENQYTMQLVQLSADSTSASVSIVPRVSPVTNATLDGQSVFTPITLTNDHPVLKWTAPRIGSTVLYHVIVYELVPGKATKNLVALLATPNTALPIPSGIFQHGSRYFLDIQALVVDDALSASGIATEPITF